MQYDATEVIKDDGPLFVSRNASLRCHQELLIIDPNWLNHKLFIQFFLLFLCLVNKLLEIKKVYLSFTPPTGEVCNLNFHRKKINIP